MNMQIALTIAGSDSGGGAGIQADLKTFHQFGVYGTSVIVAVTAQNTRGVRSVHEVPPEMVRDQLAALAEDLPPAALKTGMLANAAVVRQVADAIRGYGWTRLVVDPVMVATRATGCSTSSEGVIREVLLPSPPSHAEPDEAALAADGGEATPRWKPPAPHSRLGARAVLVKEGTCRDTLVDIWSPPRAPAVFSPAGGDHLHARHRVPSPAAITAGLALGHPRGSGVDRPRLRASRPARRPRPRPGHGAAEPQRLDPRDDSFDQSRRVGGRPDPPSPSLPHDQHRPSPRPPHW
jgi:hydroxymethylpyrimidine/phosphomethylpyrimidine kinase